MSAEPPADPGRFVQALHDLARAGAAALGYDLCAGRLPDDAPDLAWAHLDYHRLATEHGATCSRCRLILGVGGQPARPRARERPALWDLDALAGLALAFHEEHGRWPNANSGRMRAGARTWKAFALHLRRRHGLTLGEFLDLRFPELRGKE